MSLPLMRVQYRRVAAAATVLIYSAACYSWQVAGPTPAEYLVAHHPAEIQVTRVNQSKIAVRAPELRGDTLFGIVGGGLAKNDTLRRVAIPMSDVESITVEQFSAGKTLGLSLVILIPLFVIAGNACYGYGCK